MAIGSVRTDRHSFRQLMNGPETPEIMNRDSNMSDLKASVIRVLGVAMGIAIGLFCALILTCALGLAGGIRAGVEASINYDGQAVGAFTIFLMIAEGFGVMMESLSIPGWLVASLYGGGVVLGSARGLKAADAAIAKVDSPR